ncbi:MAG: bifunctional glycosyltransferase family 2/GtrA family protein [Candidatus Nanopelagicales bacterium]
MGNQTETTPPVLAAELGLVPQPREQLLDVELVLPVYNEQAVLAQTVERLDAYLTANLPYSYRITVVDNASTDRTWDLAERLAQRIPAVAAIHLDQKGRGRALRQVWLESDATVVAYMDVDLSTDLAAFLPLVAPLLSGHSDLAIGSRLTRSSRVIRGPKREVISRSYNVLLRTTLGTRFSDAQCGFKAMRADRARQLLPLVEDSEWFFDTELLVLAQRSGMRIHEVPVDWTDDPDSRVDIVATALADLRGIKRMALRGMQGQVPIALIESTPPGLPNQLVRFLLVGVASTIAFALLFLFGRQFVDAQWANAVALATTAILNTAVNRRFTFGVRGRSGVARHQVQGFGIFALGWAITAGSLALLDVVSPSASTSVELTVLVIANLAATLLRFLLLRSWVFRAHLRHTSHQSDTRVSPSKGQI